MSLIKYSNNYAQIHNDALNDPRLKFKEKGLLAYLNSKPDDWDFSAYRIARDSGDGVGSVKAGLRKLEELGYISRKKLPSGRVQFSMPQPKDQKPNDGCVAKGQKPTDGFSHDAEIDPVSNTEKTVKQKKERAKVVEFKEASPQTTYYDYELDPEKRRANHKHNMERAIACGLIKAK
jgi:hypothetical protein